MKYTNHYIKLHSILKYTGQFEHSVTIQGIIKLVSNYRIKSEIIGQWLYCFTNDLIGVQLVTIGFWFSIKHRAFIYSGSEKEGLADDESLDEIRARLGSRRIDEL